MPIAVDIDIDIALMPAKRKIDAHRRIRGTRRGRWGSLKAAIPCSGCRSSADTPSAV